MRGIVAQAKGKLLLLLLFAAPEIEMRIFLLLLLRQQQQQQQQATMNSKKPKWHPTKMRWRGGAVGTRMEAATGNEGGVARLGEGKGADLTGK